MTDLWSIRWYFGKEETVSSLFLPAGFECFIIEDQEQDVKVWGETCIPEGRYELVLHYSPKFSRPERLGHEVIMLKDVPDFKWIYIHPGIDDDDSAGCLLTGTGVWVPHIQRSRNIDSRQAYDRLHPKLVNFINEGPTFLSIGRMAPYGMSTIRPQDISVA